MLNICQEFSNEHSMLFSTDPDPAKSKTKCLHFSRKCVEVPEVFLNKEKLPWVLTAKHLGNKLTSKIFQNPCGMDSTSDLLQKRAIFFQKIHKIKQAYGFYDPKIVCEIVKIFGTSFYGSPLWSLRSAEHQQLNRSWNTVVKMIWNLPFQTHKRFVEDLTNVPHLQSVLHGRYVGFLKILKLQLNPKCPSCIIW